MSRPFRIELSRLQPSQLLVSAEKLHAVQDDYDARREPVPVKALDGRLVLTDGHTRAVAASLSGESTIWARWEADELDWEAYEICVGWCRDEGITSVTDLAGRIVPAAQYETLWLERCRAMHEQLADARTQPRET